MIPLNDCFLSASQSFLALVNLLSYPAVYELVGNQDLPNKAEYSLREVPTCVIVSHFLLVLLFEICSKNAILSEKKEQ